MQIMRIAHLIAPVAFGGGESVLTNLLSERKADLREEVLCLTASPDFGSKLTEIGIEWSEITNIDLGHGVSKSRILRIYFSILRHVPRLIGKLRQRKIDLIHAHGFPASAVVPFVRMAMPSTKAVYTHHSHRETPGLAEKAVLGLCYRSFDARTAVSETAARSIERAFQPISGSFRTVHNCVGAQFYDVTSSQATSDPEARRCFVQIGRLVGIKNHGLVLESVSRLSPEERDRVLIKFAGDGPLRTDLEQQARSLGVAANVRFLGQVPYDEIPSLLGEADFALFPSELEGFGIAAVECLAAGVPVLCLKNELMAEIVGPAGILVDKPSFHQGLRSMLQADQRLRAAARDQALKFAPAKIKEDYFRLYCEILQ